MMKKTLIIGSVILVIICLAIFLVFYMNKNKQSQNTQVPAQTSNQVSLPALPGTEKVKVDTQNISQSVQENISKAETSNRETLDTKFQDTKSGVLSLEQFRAGTNITIKPEIYSNLSETDYSVFTCNEQSGNAKGLGLIMRFKSGSTAAYYANLYKKMNENLVNWQETMFPDLSPLLFSGKRFSQKPVFKSAEYTTENGAEIVDVRYANVKSDDGLNLSVDYTVYAEDIYIFNNPQCLRKALDKYEPVLEP